MSRFYGIKTFKVHGVIKESRFTSNDTFIDFLIQKDTTVNVGKLIDY